MQGLLTLSHMFLSQKEKKIERKTERKIIGV